MPKILKCFSCLFIFVAGLVGFQTLNLHYIKLAKDRVANTPFLAVTNREMSIFLWRFPHLMPQHKKNKPMGYLADFEFKEGFGLMIHSPKEFCKAPPDLLFLYHTWDRLLRPHQQWNRKILGSEFKKFLDANMEWQVAFWTDSPEEYKKLLNELVVYENFNLAELPENSFPKIVREAFIGWKNYYFEGEKINNFEIDEQKLKELLAKSPELISIRWKNILPETNFLLKLSLYNEQSL